VLGAAFVWFNVQAQAVPRTSPDRADVPYVRLYDQPRDALEVVLNQGDGQAFAALAQDPLLARPEVFRGGSAEAAYRAQRPLLGWLAWAGAAGDAERVPEALLAWTVIGYAALGAAATAFALWTERSPVLAFAVLVMPGALVALDWTGPEVLGTAAAITALGLWRRERPPLVAVAALLVVAALCRETLLLVPAVLLLVELTDGRARRRIVALLAAPVVYGMWIGVVRIRLAAWPTDADHGRLSWPFGGIVEASSGWRSIDVACAVLGLVLAACALARRRSRTESYLVLAHLLLAACMGALVWVRFEDFARVLLPLYAVSILALLPSEANMRSSVTPNL
jgi:hypothetical protein